MENLITKASEKVYCDEVLKRIFAIKSLEMDLVIYSKDLYDTIVGIISELPEPQPQIMNMVFRDGKGEKEIAEALGMDQQEVKYCIASALRYMRHPKRAKQLVPFMIQLEDDWSEPVEPAK